MAKKPSPAPKAAGAGVTLERFRRLYRLLGLLSGGAETRSSLLRRLHLDVRGFYRDLETLRAAGVPIAVTQGRYSLAESADAARDRLPFPDPHLTVSEVRQLAKGRGASHRKLRGQLGELTS
jgi:predicted DNA-binding transcriptional regulator YafY